MELSKDLVEQVKAAKSADDLLTLVQSSAELSAAVKEVGADLTKENAEKAFARLHRRGELSDEELDNVSGAGCTQYSYNPCNLPPEAQGYAWWEHSKWYS